MRMKEKEYNPHLEGYRKCYHCKRLYNEKEEHTCYKINRIKDWKLPVKGRKVHEPCEDTPGNSLITSDN